MPTTNDDGFPLYSSGESMPGWAAAYNAQSNALSTALAASVAAGKEDDSVELIADIPVTGNWIGRRLYVEEDESLRICTALPATFLIAYRTPLVGSIVWDTDWDGEPGHSIERTADHVVLTFNGEKTTAVVSTEKMGTIPVGYRPATSVYCAGVFHGTGSPGAAAIVIEPDGDMFVFFDGTTTQKKVAFAVTYPI